MDHFVAIAAVPAPALACDVGGRIVAANPGSAALFATTETGLSTGGIGDLFPGDGGVAALLLGTDGGSLRLQGRRANGVPFTAEARASLTADGVFVLLEELSGERLLTESQRHIDLAFEHMPIGMAVFNTDGEYVRVNQALCEMLDRPAADLVGRRDQELTHPEDRQSDVDAAWRILGGEFDTWQCEKRFVRPDGSVVWALASLTFLRDEDRRPLCWVGQFQDVTHLKRAEDRLRHLAEHDDLTGIANRRRLVAELELRLEQSAREGETGAVLILDLDGFKAVNDTRGHDAGDAVLITAALALRHRLRGTDTVARLGGDEFAVIVPDVDGDGALHIAGQLIAEVRAMTGAVTASCGIALYGPDRTAATPDALLAAADRAMYAVKQQGRDAARLAD